MKSKRTLKPITNFDYFITHCIQSAYDTGIFVELRDNELSGCSRVVWCTKPKKPIKIEQKTRLNERAYIRLLDHEL